VIINLPKDIPDQQPNKQVTSAQPTASRERFLMTFICSTSLPKIHNGKVSIKNITCEMHAPNHPPPTVSITDLLEIPKMGFIL
jgi:hypothetical protein